MGAAYCHHAHRCALRSGKGAEGEGEAGAAANGLAQAEAEAERNGESITPYIGAFSAM